MNDCKIIFFCFRSSLYAHIFVSPYIYVYFVVCMFYFFVSMCFFPVVIIRFSVLLLL